MISVRARRIGQNATSSLAAYGSALLLVAAAFALRYALDPWFGGNLPLLTLFPAIAISAWRLGVGPSLVAAVVGLLGAEYLFISPRGVLEIDEIPNLLYHTSGLISLGLIILFAHMARSRAALAERAAEQRQSALRSLEQTKTEMQTLLDTVPIVIYQLDAEDRYVFANRKYEELLGVTLSELAGKHISEIFPPDVATHLIAHNREVRSTGQTLTFEEHAQWPTGSRVYSSIKTPVSGPDGPRGVLGISTDITDQKRIEAQLREADQRKDEFLAVLSHELRNPLAPILTTVQYLRLNAAKDHRLESGLEIVERQSRHMARLVDDLLDLSRLSRGSIELRREPVDLTIPIEDAVESCKPIIDRARHRLNVVLPEKALFVNGDVVRLSQIVANLINNAAKYTPPGGRIDVTLAGEGDDAVIRVTDTGIGIPAEKIDHIFAMFAQADPSSEVAKGGLGIGLTLAQQLAGMHGGGVEAVSRGPNEGSTFIVRLPLAAPPASFSSARARPTREVKAQRILIADDNIDAATSLGMLLEAEGHDVRLAHDGARALETAASFQPNIALLDIGMPELDGYQTARRIRALPNGASVRLIAITGWGQDEDRQKSLEAGFDEHLTKPVDSDTLRRVLDEAQARTAHPEFSLSTVADS